MVLSDPQGKTPERRRNSVSPRRERGRRKPRQEWLVAVGQGQSPASTRSRDSKGNSPSGMKKIDVDTLSFKGLERQVRIQYDTRDRMGSVHLCRSVYWVRLVCFSGDRFVTCLGSVP